MSAIIGNREKNDALGGGQWELLDLRLSREQNVWSAWADVSQGESSWEPPLLIVGVLEKARGLPSRER